MIVGILPNVNSFKLNRDKCLFPHHNKVEEQPNKRPKKSTQNANGEDKGTVAVVKTVPQLGCLSQDSEPSGLPKGVKYRETRSMKFLDQLDEYGSPSLHCVKQVSEKRKDHHLEKYKSNFLISAVPTL